MIMDILVFLYCCLVLSGLYYQAKHPDSEGGLEGTAETVVLTIATPILVALNGLFFSWLWNLFMPSIFGLPQITFIQAVGLTCLKYFLFPYSTPQKIRRSKK